ncbi:hypothetical protein TIFTF001_039883 [Ficus carica]|uniref:Uncharacterized protein n=1 Tax=Ficus carica TaxID=3494 RepID=A0AA87YX58_FICCA|nr:hypothetical protein TIFTF001_039883 [Ficus carica]
MSGEYDGLVKDNAENIEEIELAEQEIKKESQASTRQDQTKVVTHEGEDKQLADALDAITTDIRRTKEKKSNVKMGRKKIQEIHDILLRNGSLKEYFKPKECSIGPIHASDSTSYKKELKLKLAACFIEESRSTGALFLEKIKSEVKDIKAYFAEEVIKSYTDEELLRLVFLDGCAMLGFIHSYVHKKLNMFNISNCLAVLMQQDLFLLENQIPFRVLDVLLHVNESQTTSNLIYNFIKFTISSSVIVLKSSRNDLDLVKFCMSINLGREEYDVEKCLNKSYDLPEQWSNMQSFHNVQELKAAGIKFKPTDSLKTISFHSRFIIRFQLSLPTLVVDNSTKRMLLNLIAYEMCQSSDYVITSYVNLPDLLVDNEQDVKNLRAAGIIRNCLSSDNDVAQLINSIGSNCSLPPSNNFAHVKYIDKHYKRRCAIWIAQVCHAHFSNPLTVLALVAATVVLALTAVQTWYAVNPESKVDVGVFTEKFAKQTIGKT